MKHVALFGTGPLSNEKDGICTAGGLRTEQFLMPLKKYHHVRLFLICEDGTREQYNAEGHFTISRNSPDLLPAARKFMQQSDTDVVVGVNTFPAYVASRTVPDHIPFWADLNGWIMAEMQAQSHEIGHNHYLARGWEQEQSILLRADQISTVSTPQKYAVWGELSALGRLNKEHFAQDWVHVVPNTRETESPQVPPTSETSFISSLFQKNGIPDNAFVVAQIGGFNNWLDEKTLFHGVEKAMEQDDSLHFVSTGGNIFHIASHPFSRFKQRIRSSPYGNRFHLLGWIEGAHIAELYGASDIGVMADIACVETATGARNRLNEMMKFGLPIVTTRGSEISMDIKKWNCGSLVESGDSSALADAILELKASPALRKQFSENSQKVCSTVLTYENTTKPLLEWIALHNRKLLHRHRTRLQGIRATAQGAIQFFRERGVKAFFRRILKSVFQK